ncbi:hypothetical protein QBC46DRAFT_402591 [Diplogelasinospora grovesii]|uniref:Uncharacterized protein n=1 Tax=Diplogelasinospora grovesii TaxID=303347 RepID=A0AAN6NI04_9PEZI|nr:hypothetical protein QBC46DRAFT_402591 [Diplogelasinospora grovesii]
MPQKICTVCCSFLKGGLLCAIIGRCLVLAFPALLLGLMSVFKVSSLSRNGLPSSLDRLARARIRAIYRYDDTSASAAAWAPHGACTFPWATRKPGISLTLIPTRVISTKHSDGKRFQTTFTTPRTADMAGASGRTLSNGSSSQI